MLRLIIVIAVTSVLTITYGYSTGRSGDNPPSGTSTSFVEVHRTPYLIYRTLGPSKPRFEVFEKAWYGFLHMHRQNLIDKKILTIIDYELSSTEKRLWVIDMSRGQVLYNELVAHGMNSGEHYATQFSNISGSHMSSLGFFATGGTYYGKHGLSLFLDGIEPGINDKARARAIVMHGAHYVNKAFIDQHGRLGRSFGCPALSYKVHETVIGTIANKSCVFIHGASSEYNTLSNIIPKALPGYTNLGELISDELQPIEPDKF